jgi:serine/threonine protein kinase
VGVPLSPGDRIGSYEIIALLSAGGMGQVYRARDLKLGRMAAIKVLPDTLGLDDERRSRFLGEARILAALSPVGRGSAGSLVPPDGGR